MSASPPESAHALTCGFVCNFQIPCHSATVRLCNMIAWTICLGPRPRGGPCNIARVEYPKRDKARRRTIKPFTVSAWRMS